MLFTTLAVRARGADPRAAALLADARALGYADLEEIELWDLFFFAGDLSDPERRLLHDLIVDPVAQLAQWDLVAPPQSIEVTYLPGVTDTVAEQLWEAARRSGLPELEAAATGTRYLLRGGSARRGAAGVESLLYNPTIQQLNAPPPLFPGAPRRPTVAVLPLRELSPEELERLSAERRTALDRVEMLAIQAYFREQNRDPSDAELEMLAQTWSEHCCHKTFRAVIEVEAPIGGAGGGGNEAPGSVTLVDGLLDTYIRAATEKVAAPWVVSAFEDNAGIIEFDEGWWLAFKVETHNHPSAIEPFGGANTGVGGVVRDVLGVSARPIAATDVLCFGPTEMALAELPGGVLHPRRIRSGVVAGIQDYGNKLGVPVVAGAVRYHAGYVANPLVYCGCLGALPPGSHPRQTAPGDRILALGGRTGRDGLRGATFSSMAMEVDTGTVAGASVQIGHPFLEKGLIEVVVAARDAKLYHAITDCGAGGLSSAIGEMAADTGALVSLERAPLKYAGLDPWEVWLSEAQERMVMAVPPERVEAVEQLCRRYGVECADLGEFAADGRLRVEWGGQSLIDLDCHFLHRGVPRRRLRARLALAVPDADSAHGEDLLAWLGDPNVGSQADVIRRFDHEVQGGSVVRALVGEAMDGPSDGAVLRPQGYRGPRALVLSCGLGLCQGDPYHQAYAAVDEAIRNAVCLGADPERVALLDNFCWGDPRRPETLGTLVEAARACHDAAVAYGCPFISGKDSLNNEYIGEDGQRAAIPGTLLISALGRLERVEETVTSDFKGAGHEIYLLESPLPALPLYRSLHQAMRRSLVRAAHDLSEGGLAVALAEMCIGGRLGARVEADHAYTERPGRILVEVAPQDSSAFLALVPARRLGLVTDDGWLRLNEQAYPLEQLVGRWCR